jgi:hypothetical protein
LRPDRLVAAHLAADLTHPASHWKQAPRESSKIGAGQLSGVDLSRSEDDRNLVDSEAASLNECHHRAEAPMEVVGQRLGEERFDHRRLIHAERGGRVADATRSGCGLDRAIADSAQNGARDAVAGRRTAAHPPRPDRQSAAASEVDAHEIRDLASVVLPVTVERHDDVESLVDRRSQTGHQRSDGSGLHIVAHLEKLLA